MKGVIDVEVTHVPSYLRCPISLDLMKDPVTLCTGITYDRQSIETWLDAGNNFCPVTNQILHSQDTIPNHTLRRIIQDWCVANKAQRIPTPKAPLDPAQLNSILREISAGEKKPIQKLRRLGRESERNRRCIVSSNASSVLASVFAKHALNRSQSSVEICEEALGALALTFPLNSQALDLLVLNDPISCLVRILRESNPEGKNSAVAVIHEMVSKDKYRDTIGGTDGLIEGLVGLLREPICPAATKASLAAIYNIALRKKYRTRVVEAGAVPVVVEMLVQAERSICERALLALDILCNCTEGRLAACGNALTVAVVAKKILRESDLASQLAVSILWNICQNSCDGGAAVEAVHAGAFDKLLVLVQVGCSDSTKDKATKLLKLFNAHTQDLECAHTIHLHFIKRSY